MKYILPEDCSDAVSDVQIPLFFKNETSISEGNSLRMLSLFSGCGGMDIGFEGDFICHRKSIPVGSNWIKSKINRNWIRLKKNRFKTVFANDILPEAFKTWVRYMSRYNISSDIYHFDSIVNLVKLHKSGVSVFPENIDIVTGGFPCQDFSVAGKRNGFNSTRLHNGEKRTMDVPSVETRGQLYYWMKQVIDITKPKIFIAENVKGLVSLGDVKNIIQNDFASADSDGYYVFTPQILHAGNYGVPETRERVIFIGVRKSSLKDDILKILESGIVPEKLNPYPLPTHNFNLENEILAYPVTCRDVLSDLYEPEESLDLTHRTYSKAKWLNRGQGQTEINLDGLGPTIRSEHHGNIEFRRLSVEHGGNNLEEINKGLKERRLSPRECALIQTFPPDYPFVFYKGYTKKLDVSPSGAYKVIGNAVPPVLAYNIAKRLEELWDIYFK